MSLKAKLILAVVLIGGAVGGAIWGLTAFCDFCADAREADVRNEWSQEKLDLIAARQAAEEEAAKLRKEAEKQKQDNTQHGEQVIVQTRNLDPDWSSTKLPPGLFDTLRQN